MASPTSARGRLPQRVYWFRRVLVVALAMALVFGIGKLLGGTGSDGRTDRAAPASAGATDSPPAQAPTRAVPVGPVAPTGALARGKRSAPAPVLAEPSGPCLDDEVTVLPSVPKAAAGGTIPIRLQLLGTQPACTFEVKPTTLVVKISSGQDRIWSTQDCPDAIAPQTVVVRSSTPVEVTVPWHGRRSDDECSTHTAWALPGFYHVFAAAMGSTPTDVQFEVTLPDRPVVTRTVKPKPAPTASATPAPGAASPASPAPTKKKP